ncbi:MAG TPA: hypothetical protein VMV49_11870, partial [Candidatus Deferrimicrobium sp.]|nr:hypothetical protein [Candidatus Deferrimicrobium sp.]
GSGVGTVFYFWGINTTPPVNWNIQGALFVVQYAVQIPDGTAGDIYLHVFANDSLGNLNITFFHFLRNSEKPQIALFGIINGSSFPGETLINLTIISSIGISNVVHNWDNKDNITLGEIYQTPLPAMAGTHILKVYVQDVAGNWAYASFIFVTQAGSEHPIPGFGFLALLFSLVGYTLAQFFWKKRGILPEFFG